MLNGATAVATMCTEGIVQIMQQVRLPIRSFVFENSQKLLFADAAEMLKD